MSLGENEEETSMPCTSDRDADMDTSEECPPQESPIKQRRDSAFGLLLSMNESELDRFEAFKRSSISKLKMKKLLSKMSPYPVNDEKILIVLCSLAKMFVGQLIQESKRISISQGEEGPLRPAHVRKAFKALEGDGVLLRRLSKHGILG